MLPQQALTRVLKNVPRLEFGSFTDSRIFKLSIGVIFLMLVSFQSYAQNDSWTLLKEESGVKVYYKVAACDSDAVIDPLEWVNGDPTHETFQLKLVNENNEDKSVTFSKVTKTDDSDEFEIITISSGTTLLESCKASPKLRLTKTEGDHFPVAMTDFLIDFQITIKD